MDINEIRIANVRKLIEARGGHRAFAEFVGIPSSYLSQMVGDARDPDNPLRRRNVVSERKARQIEEKCGLDKYSLDQPLEEDEDARVEVAPAKAVDETLISRAIRATMEVIEAEGVQLKPTKIGDIADIVYAEAQLTGTIRNDFIKKLLKLAT